MIRIVRAATLAVAGQDFVIQAQIAGAGIGRILALHLLPNVAGAIVVQAAYSISFGMIIESGISFLGLGVQPPGASLGSLLHDGRLYLSVAPWLVFAPGFVLAITILSSTWSATGSAARSIRCSNDARTRSSGSCDRLSIPPWASARNRWCHSERSTR